ncbi:hypothetical protein BCR36DRAFT_453294 [Piromyces finnis]|uniref:CLIP1 zinc knuckle domain-containing protein n=1 Tax=Piromyces finnis TaxID=1754191 RepID=A0A1Y1VKP8_9FUNG|nr:hypothetical protein BCR36DRAFT_453294 [Piromyces finnis]|eukprot:ORX59057.1 hypothetical protein BCR36DRAFT_453294 [Piromyces finnis]
MESAFLMLKKIQRNYGGGENDITYWMMKSDSLKTSNEKEITNVLEEMTNIFDTLEKADCKLSNTEKLKYLYNALPGEYMKKYILKDSTKYEELNKEIREDIKNRAYVLDWTVDNRRDDPMEIDFVNRGSNSKKHYTKDKMDQHKNKKYCAICEKNGHTTNECWFNAQKEKFKGKSTNYVGYVQDPNDYYNSNLDFQDIKTMFFEDNNTIGDKNNNINDNVNLNKKLYKDKKYKNYIKNVFNLCYKDFRVNNVLNFKKSSWLYDSGAGEHLTNNKNLLINFKKRKIILRCANNTSVVFEGYCKSIKFKTDFILKTKQFLLTQK